MVRGTPFWGSRGELLFLTKWLDRYYRYRENLNGKNLSNFWPKFFTAYLRAYPIPKSIWKDKKKTLKTWFRNKANRNQRADDIVYIPPKGSEKDLEKNSKKPKINSTAKSALRKSIRRLLTGRPVRRKKSAPETYAQLYSEEFKPALRDAWRAHRRAKITASVMLLRMDPKARKEYFKNFWLSFRRNFLLDEYSVLPESTKRFCERYKDQHTSSLFEDQDELRRMAVENLEITIHETLQNLSDATGYSFILIGGGPDPRIQEKLSMIRCEVTAADIGTALGDELDYISLIEVQFMKILKSNSERRTSQERREIESDLHSPDSNCECLSSKVGRKFDYDYEGSRSVTYSDNPDNFEQLEAEEQSNFINRAQRRSRRYIIQDSDTLSNNDDSMNHSMVDAHRSDEDEEEQVFLKNAKQKRHRRVIPASDIASNIGDFTNESMSGIHRNEEENESEDSIAESSNQQDNGRLILSLAKMELSRTSDSQDFVAETEATNEIEIQKPERIWSTDRMETEMECVVGEENSEMEERAERLGIVRTIDDNGRRKRNASTKSTSSYRTKYQEVQKRNVDADTARLSTNIHFDSDSDFGGYMGDDESEEECDEYTGLIDDQIPADFVSNFLSTIQKAQNNQSIADAINSIPSAQLDVVYASRHRIAVHQSSQYSSVDASGRFKVITSAWNQSNRSIQTIPRNTHSISAAFVGPQDTSDFSSSESLDETDSIQPPDTIQVAGDPSSNHELPDQVVTESLNISQRKSQMSASLVSLTPLLTAAYRDNAAADDSQNNAAVVNIGQPSLSASVGNPDDDTDQLMFASLSSLTPLPTTDSQDNNVDVDVDPSSSSVSAGNPLTSWIMNGIVMTNKKESPIPYIRNGRTFIDQTLGDYTPLMGPLWEQHESLKGNEARGGKLQGRDKMPKEVEIFTRYHKFSTLPYPDDPKEYGVTFYIWYKGLQEYWRLDPNPPFKSSVERRVPTLFNDHNNLPEGETFELLDVGGVDGFFLVIVGVALWWVSAKRHPRGRRESLKAERAIQDILEVLQMINVSLLKAAKTVSINEKKRKSSEKETNGKRKVKKMRN